MMADASSPPAAPAAPAPVAEPAPAPAVVEPTPPAVVDWHDALPDNLKADETLATIESPEVLAKSYLELRSKVGGNVISLPGNDATDEQRTEFWMKLGRPEKADGYEVPANLPEGVSIDADQVKEVWPKFLEMGLSKQQGAETLRIYAEHRLAENRLENTKFREQAETDLKALKADWGAAYEERIELAHNAADTLKIRQWLHDQGFGEDPTMLKALAEVGKWLDQDQVKGRGKRSFIPSVEEAKIDIDKLRADPAFMKGYDDRHDPAHSGANERMSKLYAIAFPGDHQVGEAAITIQGP